jgi:hypothetical protein
MHRRMLCAGLLSTVVFAGSVSGDEPRQIGDGEFQRLHQLIAPHSGESRWMEIDWFSSVWEARQKAAAEGKPIFLMAGSGGAPAAGC